MYIDFLLNNTCGPIEDTRLSLDPQLFRKGGCILCFNLLPDQPTCSDPGSALESGTLTLSLKLKKEQAKPFAVICVLQYEKILEISAGRNVTVR
jgi:hypothetical protein